MPCESSLTDHIQPGLQLRNDALIHRSDILDLLLSHLGRILRRASIGRLLCTLMNLRELADRDEIVRSGVEHAKKLGACVLETTKFEERPAERDPRG